MKISKLWEGYKFPKCDQCKKECSGHLKYDELCSNVNYLREYGEKNYNKNKESLIELKKVIGKKIPTIFSFGCGIGLDYIGAKDVFGEDVKYFGVDECEWAITKTNNYKNFNRSLPQVLKFNVGTFLLGAKHCNLVLCFFNSLFVISENTNLYKLLIGALKLQDEFYLVCDYTINNNFHMPSVEIKFIENLIKDMSCFFKINRFDILEGKGIIIKARKY